MLIASTRMNQRIRFGEPFEPTIPEERLPQESLLLPNEANDVLRHEHFQVYLVDVVREAIQRHVGENLRVETGGILVGHPFADLDDPKKKFVVIVGSVRQDSNSRSAGHFTVDPAEIATSRAELERRYPGLMAVGWYHSHPGLGVFLSAQDMRIVHSIYNAGWQVALVLNPQREDELLSRARRKETFGLARAATLARCCRGDWDVQSRKRVTSPEAIRGSPLRIGQLDPTGT